jgi:hypothetical protein
VPGDCTAFNSTTVLKDGGIPCGPGHFANPTGAVGLSVVNGAATTAMRSDAAPPLSASVQSALTGTINQVLAGTGAFGFSPITNAQLTALINPFTSGLSGAVPASGGGTTNFLRADGTFAAPPAAGNAVSFKTANYTIATSDCGSTVQYGTGSTGFITATLPAVAGFPAGCLVTVKNGDTYPAGRGKLMAGWPADCVIGTILYPLQSCTVQVINSAWVTTSPAGRWRNPTTVTWHVDKTNGGNSNDGLATGSGNALLDAQTANTRAVYHSDTQGTTPIIAMACGQTHTTAMNMGGTPSGTNLIQLSPDGNCGFTWTNASPCAAVADLAELDLNLTFYGASGTALFGCNSANAASTGNILLHNDVVLDLEGTPTWNPQGVNDNFLFCDGMCQFTIANGITHAGGGTGNYIIYMSAGGHGTQSGVISASGAGTDTGVYYLFGGALFVRGTSDGAGWTSIGPSKVFGHATLVNNGVTTAGGVTVGASGVNCTSLTATC